MLLRERPGGYCGKANDLLISDFECSISDLEFEKDFLCSFATSVYAGPAISSPLNGIQSLSHIKHSLKTSARNRR
jgi:hypothetical protein